MGRGGHENTGPRIARIHCEDHPGCRLVSGLGPAEFRRAGPAGCCCHARHGFPRLFAGCCHRAFPVDPRTRLALPAAGHRDHRIHDRDRPAAPHFIDPDRGRSLCAGECRPSAGHCDRHRRLPGSASRHAGRRCDAADHDGPARSGRPLPRAGWHSMPRATCTSMA